MLLYEKKPITDVLFARMLDPFIVLQPVTENRAAGGMVMR
jgi:hypothetical protein